MTSLGTASLTELFEQMRSQLDGDCERRRAMFLSWVDEMERWLGYGEPGRPPRTSQIRQYWRDQGEPKLKGG